ncbi:MAG: BtaA family protein [Sphingomonadales bacterium]|nr:BtaA family protein [Sphingomonadales bacterium]MDE2568680.1 BtaA family protein [Sphingomonadales bacterium]
MNNRGHEIDRAVMRNGAEPKAKMLDRAFALAFRGLVYAQIWEDPVVDMEALEIRPDSHVVTIASGGCNVLSYLTADPARVTAVDLNTAHVALGRLKQASVRHLPDYAAFRSFFAEADRAENLQLYRQYIAPHLDDATRRYWEGRDLAGRRRIAGFGKGIYRRGLLGNFIGAAHLLAKLYRIDIKAVLEAETLEDQRRVFEEKLAPLFDRKFVRWLTDQPASLFGLGIPPAQYDALAGDRRMAEVLKARLEKLACGFPVGENYFAWQAFSRGYGKHADCPLPPYLEERNYQTVKARIDRIETRHANMTDFLDAQGEGSVDRVILLDAQDWMDDVQLTALWSAITCAARPGARVLFRTAAEHSLLPGRVPDSILARWDYAEARSRKFTDRDRSSIYGGVHLYTLRP